MKLCLGTAQFGLNYGIAAKEHPDLSQSIEIMEFAYENGVRCFDTAAGYGNAENIVGKFIKRLCNRKDMLIASKLPMKALENIAPERYYEIIKENVEISIEKLNSSYLDYFLLHNSKEVFNNSILEALNRLTQDKLVKKVGVSIYTPQEADAAVTSSFVSAIQIPYNILDKRLNKTEFFNKTKNKTIFCRSILLQGLLVMDEKEIPEKMQFAKETLTKFFELCRKYSLSPKELAVAYVNTKKEINYALIGVDSLDQLSEQLGLFTLKLDMKILQDADLMFNEVSERVLNPSLW